MFERIVRNIVPPEMAALLLPATTSPKIRGYLFRRNANGLYHGINGVLTILKSRARVYSISDAEYCSRNKWNWGTRQYGTWVVVYA